MREKNILFICQGNVGRSQMAEGFYNAFSGKREAISAGIDDVGKKYNYHPTPAIIQVMMEEGIDISLQKVKQVNPSMLEVVKRIVVLCEKGICPSYITDSLKSQYYEVADPFTMGIESTREVRDEIKKITLEMLERR